MRYNPFQPNRIVHSGMFVGRYDEMKKIDQYLFQAKMGNPQHFLLEGERGIGKSSMMFLASNVASGKLPTMGDESHNFNLLTVSTDMAGVASQVDVIRAIARELKSEIASRAPVREKASKAWEFLTKWEILGVRYHRENAPDPDDARDALVGTIQDVLSSGADLDGVCILIDEADAPPVEAGLGEFLKAFTERLTKRGCDNVIICLAGLPSTIAKLRASHESSPRLLSVLSLRPLEPEERKDAIRRGLKVANSKNPKPTQITDEALELLSEMSEGYPHFVQQFAYCAFDADSDDVIGVEDVLHGAYVENGAIDQLGSKYFNEVYYSKIGSDEYRKVLNVMADSGDAWVSKADIRAGCGIKETTLGNALTALKGRNIIYADEGRQGFYRLPTKSFAAWINAVNSVEEKRGAGPLSITEGA